MGTFLDTLRTLAYESQVDDVVAITCLRTALPAQYSTVIAGRLADAAAQGRRLSLAYMIDFLRNYAEDVAPLASAAPAKPQALTRTTSAPTAAGKTELWCTHCGRAGHTKDTCFLLHPELLAQQATHAAARDQAR